MNVIFIITLAKILITDAKDNELEKLEKEKEDIFNKINEAIDDTIKSFQRKNDSESLQGISYMEDLKKQLTATNTDEIETDGKDKNTSREIRADARRNTKIKLSILDIANIFTKRPSKSRQTRDENKEVMQDKIFEWVKQRELERAKIRQYKMKQRKAHAKHKHEKCPRFGKGDFKKKKLFRRTAQGNGRPKYPCCRKCCKKSYLGCL